MKRDVFLIGEFAAKAAVTVRTVRYYHHVGLLAPAAVTAAGQRLYTVAELVKLQQILALKLLGFSLAEIRRGLHSGPQDFARALAAQRAMLAEQRSRLDASIRAIEADAAPGGEVWMMETLLKAIS